MTRFGLHSRQLRFCHGASSLLRWRVRLVTGHSPCLCQAMYMYVYTHIRWPFEKFLDSPCYSESDLFGGAVTVSFSKYLRWQAMHFLQRSTHFSKMCCRPFAASFRRIVEQAVLTFYYVRFSVSKALPALENRSSSPQAWWMSCRVSEFNRATLTLHLGNT
jgi:hypothetical protein